MRRKLGLSAALDGDAELIRNLLTLMQESHADFTLTFRRLSLMAGDPGEQSRVRELFSAASNIDGWLKDWQERATRETSSAAERATSMCATNPAFIPRNHRVEAALSAAESADYAPFHKLLGVLQRPYEEQPDAAEYGQPPNPSERVLQTFCGT
jgi:uncharacterized protein YdiU (UPF0061 family)